MHRAVVDSIGTQTITYWIGYNHPWGGSPEGYEFWDDIYNMMYEIDMGKGIKHEPAVKEKIAAEPEVDDNVKDTVAGYSAALVVHFDHDIKGRFGNRVKKMAEDCHLEIVCVMGNTLVVTSGEGHSGMLVNFKRRLGLTKR